MATGRRPADAGGAKGASIESGGCFLTGRKVAQLNLGKEPLAESNLHGCSAS